MRSCYHWLMVAPLLLACPLDTGPTDDGTLPPFDLSGNPDDQRAECTRAIDRAATECPAPLDLRVIDFDEDPGQASLDIIDLASVSTPVAGGLYVPADPSLPSNPTLGHVLADNEACQVACTVPCDVSRNDFCAAQADDRSCSFCGPPSTLEQCETFVAACE